MAKWEACTPELATHGQRGPEEAEGREEAGGGRGVQKEGVHSPPGPLTVPSVLGPDPSFRLAVEAGSSGDQCRRH